MIICFPVQQDNGIESQVFNHFGSAPLFLVVDTDTHAVEVIRNGDRVHAHGACNPLKALENRAVDAVIVGGIGAGALTRLAQAGARVYRAAPGTVAENLKRHQNGELAEYALQSCCGGHGQGHGRGGGCAHH